MPVLFKIQTSIKKSYPNKLAPALTKRQRKRLLKREKAFKHREDATRRQTERAREQEQKQKQTETEKKLDADFQLDGKTLPGPGWATG